MDTESIIAPALALPEVAAWPGMVELLERAERKPRLDWKLPLLACQVLGRDTSLAIPGAAAIACIQISIILVDDMLDEDPRGEHLRSGVGPTANLALALQAAAFRVIGQAAVGADRRAGVIDSLAAMCLATSLGQHLDVQNLDGEENYWKVVRAKSTPFYAAALHVGALLAGATVPVTEGLRDLGILIGEIIQIRDDLVDAFQAPANPDWQQGRNNLALLYARTASHPERARFIELLPEASDAQALRQAQKILIDSGAVSYCAYQLIRRRQEAKRLLDSLPLNCPVPITNLLARQTSPVVSLLETVGVEGSAELVKGF